MVTTETRHIIRDNRPIMHRSFLFLETFGGDLLLYQTFTLFSKKRSFLFLKLLEDKGHQRFL